MSNDVLNNADLLTGHSAQDKFEAPTENSKQSDKETNFYIQSSLVDHIQSVENDTTNGDLCLQLNGQYESEAQSEVTNICSWCHCVNELRLNWCENCGCVINNEQECSPNMDLLNSDMQILDSSYYSNTQTNFALLSCSDIKTNQCTQLQAQGDSYQRHWKKSSYYMWMKPSSSLALLNKVDHISVGQLSKLLILVNYHIWSKSKVYHMNK